MSKVFSQDLLPAAIDVVTAVSTGVIASVVTSGEGRRKEPERYLEAPVRRLAMMHGSRNGSPRVPE